MSDSTLTTAETLLLLLELSRNDAFRERFTEKPAAALVELGIPYTTVVNLNSACLCPARKLAPKQAFHDAHAQLLSSDINRTQSMVIPKMLLDTDAKSA